ncbi:MAG TPA: DUF917 domain-containing protein [Actinopolymorphaceae bacterium]
MPSLTRLTLGDVEALAHGCTLLGSGGGGSVEIVAPLLRRALQTAGTVPVTRASDLPPAARVACIGAVGSPNGIGERLPSGTEFARAARALEDHTGVPFDAVQPLEIGGLNGLVAPVAASSLGLPLLDSDAMGRAYPRLDHTVLLGVVPASPLALANATGDVLILDSQDDRVERLVRSVLAAMGTWAAVCIYPGPAALYAEYAVSGSVDRALRLGQAFAAHRRREEAARTGSGTPDGEGPDVLTAAGATTVFEGTVLEVRRDQPITDVGGVATLGHAVDEHRSLRLDFANEYVAAFDDGVPVAVAPDIICVLDARTWASVAVERLAVRQRVRVIRLPAPPELTRRRPERIDLGLRAYDLAPIAPIEVGR